MFRVAILAFCWFMAGQILVKSTKAKWTHKDNNLMGGHSLAHAHDCITWPVVDMYSVFSFVAFHQF